MKIVYATTSLPYTAGEAFIIPEVLALMRNGYEVLVVPRSPGHTVVHRDAKPLVRMTIARALLALDVLKGACAEWWRTPGRALRALGLLFRSRNPLVLLKNLAVYPKGLWLGRMARRERGIRHSLEPDCAPL